MKFQIHAYGVAMSTFDNLSSDLLTFSCLNLVNILISLSVLWQYVWCSNGEIFLIATFCLVTVSRADL